MVAGSARARLRQPRNSLDLQRGDAIVPRVRRSGGHAPLPQVGDVAGGAVLAVPIVAVVEDCNARACKDTNRRDAATVTPQRRATLSASHAEVIARKVVPLVEAGSAVTPVSAIPVAAGRPGIARTGVHPAGAARTANSKYRAATAIDPQTLSIHAPTLIPDARRSADLALKGHLVEAVTTTILPVTVVRLTGDALRSSSGLLRGRGAGDGKYCEHEPKDEKSSDVCLHIGTPGRLGKLSRPETGVSWRSAALLYHGNNKRKNKYSRITASGEVFA